MLKFDDLVHDLFQGLNHNTAAEPAAAPPPPAPESDGVLLSPDQYYKAGISYLQRNEHPEAMNALSQAYRLKPADPFIKSYYGLSLALCRRQGAEAIRLCEEAVGPECFYSECFLNLGRVYLMSGQRGKAFTTLMRGMRLGQSPEILAQLQTMGMRRPPVFRFLRRTHPVNKWAGITLTRLGMR